MRRAFTPKVRKEKSAEQKHTEALSQYFTPDAHAEALIGLAGPLLDDARRRAYRVRVLEPSSGRGHLVRAILARCPLACIDAVEIDPALAGEPIYQSPQVNLESRDYLLRPAPGFFRYQLAISNPPYSEGVEVDHIAKILDESDRACLLLPERALHGKRRYERVWYRFDPKSGEKRDWYLHRKVHCVRRPRFGGAYGGSDEIVLLDLRRTPGECAVSWL